MIIGMILDNEFTGDMRVENEVISLVEAGHEVYVLCFNYGKKETLEKYHGAQIIRIPIMLKFKNKMKGLVNFFIDPYTRYWAGKIAPFVKKYKIEVLHVHDLYLLGAAFNASKRFVKKIPIVGDLHENYPEALKYYKFSNTFPGNILISIPKWERTEKRWIKQVDHIITIIEEAKERYVRLGAEREKITVVANYVNEDEFLSEENNSEIADRFKDDFVVSYSGGFDIHRGIECVIRSVPLIKKEIPNFRLVLVGAGKNEIDLKNLAKKLKVENEISFEGWQLAKKIPEYISASDICLIPHLKIGQTDNGIPHKLFQYMLLEKPVVSTNCDPLERILKASKAGLIYTSDNEKELARQVIHIYKNPEEAKEMGKNGIKAVKKIYNWKNTAKNLIQLYKKIELEEGRS